MMPQRRAAFHSEDLSEDFRECAQGGAGREKLIAPGVIPVGFRGTIAKPGSPEQSRTARCSRTQCKGTGLVADAEVLDVNVTAEPRVEQQIPAGMVIVRSEEHTSELQSPCNLVCRLLLEKKKKKRVHTRCMSDSY